YVMRVARLTPPRTLSKFGNKSRTAPSHSFEQSPFYTLGSERAGFAIRMARVPDSRVTHRKAKRSGIRRDSTRHDVRGIPRFSFRDWNDLCYIFFNPSLRNDQRRSGSVRSTLSLRTVPGPA